MRIELSDALASEFVSWNSFPKEPIDGLNHPTTKPFDPLNLSFPLIVIGCSYSPATLFLKTPEFLQINTFHWC